jgi:hypothetical protein
MTFQKNALPLVQYYDLLQDVVVDNTQPGFSILVLF